MVFYYNSYPQLSFIPICNPFQMVYSTYIAVTNLSMTITQIRPGYYKASLKRDNGSTDLYGADRTQLIMSLIEEAYA